MRRRLVTELHEGHLEQQPGIGCVTHLDEDPAEAFHRPHQLRRAQAHRLLGHCVRLRVGQRHQLGRHQRQEAVAQVTDDVVGERARVAALMHGVRHTGEGPARVEVDERLDELGEVDGIDLVATRGGDELERAERVARGAAALLERGLDGGFADLQAGIGHHPAHMRLEFVHRQQVEPQVLGAATDGLADLLRVGGGQHEHHVRRRLLERLQQRRLGTLRQHVHLVEDVHLVPPRRAERGLLDEVAHRLDTVVAGGVELVHVVTGAALDRDAGIALAARFAVDRALAVEHLREDARRGGLARATWAGEQVGLALAMVDDGIAQSPHNMLLPAHLAEAARAVAAVERLGGHRCGAYSGGARRGARRRCRPHIAPASGRGRPVG